MNPLHQEGQVPRGQPSLPARSVPTAPERPGVQRLVKGCLLPRIMTAHRQLGFGNVLVSCLKAMPTACEFHRFHHNRSYPRVTSLRDDTGQGTKMPCDSHLCHTWQQPVYTSVTNKFIHFPGLLPSTHQHGRVCTLGPTPHPCSKLLEHLGWPLSPLLL